MRDLDDATLVADLAFYRDVVVRKLEGLDRERATAVRLPSGVTLLGVVQHLAWVEREWFGHCLRGEPMADWEPEESFVVAPGLTVEDVVADYRAACAAGEAATAAAGSFDVATVEPHWYFGIVTLRFVLQHLLKETARHAGHLDVLRELTDGATGFA